ncbi:MAG: response regulator [Marinifilaceae bacterium]|nr:response regulator [Marinifilaceae bacterium]
MKTDNIMRFKIYFTLLLILLSNFIFSQKKKLFDYNEGLSNSLINQVYQDHLGFLWVATEDGLNQFDGIKFKSHTNNINLSNTLKNNFVTAVTEDHKGNLWVAQINGLQIYKHETESFQEIELALSHQKDHLFISSIITSSNGDVWLTTTGHGLIRIDKNTQKPDYCEKLNEQLGKHDLVDIFEDKEGILWIASNQSLNSFDPATKKIKNFTLSKHNQTFFSNKEISCICEGDQNIIYIGFLNGGLAQINKQTEIVNQINSANQNENNLPVKEILFDSKNRLWVGTDGFGLKLLNKESNQLENYTTVNASFDFLKSKIHSIIEDNEGNIWLGIFQKGIYLLPVSQETFKTYGYKAFDQNSIGSNCITAIDGNEKELWIATDGDGLYYLDRLTKKVKHIPLKNESGNFVGENILTLYNDSNDYLWLGRFINGLIRYDKKNRTFKTFTSKKNNASGKAYNKITSITKNNHDQLIIGTLGDGICRFDTQKELYYDGLDIPDSLNEKIPKWILCVYIDKDQNLWIGTYVGLFHVNLKRKSLTQYSKENGLLKNNTVDCILADSKNNIWIGTYEGLAKINTSNSTSVFYDVSDGLCNNVICSLIKDEYNQLWIGTHNGLSRFNPEDETFTNYYSHDGIQANEFSRNAAFKSDKQELFFGGINGITQISKDYATISREVRDVILTEFLSFDKPVKIGDKSGEHVILDKSIVLEDTIRLREQDNVFSIGFTSTDFANQTAVSYEYIMEGFDLSWNVTNSTNKRATYTNLNHGTYTFSVRAVDKENLSTPRKLTIIIYPPWYKMLWAKILWTLLIGTFFYGIFLLYMEKVKRLHAEKVNEMKMQFFINISHEIKTPLSLILDPLEKLIKQNFDEKNSRLFFIMQQNTNRIYRLVSQMMDVRRIDKGQILIKFQQTNIYSFIKEIAQSFELLANDKNISFSITTSDPDIEVWIDPLNFEKVIFNLLSNAFKFTLSGGEIELSIAKEIIEKGNHQHEQVKISVSDTGVGIKESEIERIFDRFYQVYSPDTKHSTGTGIGLHLSRSLVSLHKGKLLAENRNDRTGSRFIIALPLGNEHLSPKDLITETTALPVAANKYTPQVSKENIQIPIDKNVKRKTNYKVMIVDDEVDIRNYLYNELSTYYKVVACENGRKAHEILLDEKPDLILSDIMMPEMDGITLCKRVKANILTNHIPVILLTALSKEENEIEGIETGADMYLVKPFKSEFILKMISNILENRKKIYSKLQPKAEHEIENIEIKSHDEILMQKVMDIIKDNISNSELNVEMLADGVGISRVHMHRKLKELTNQSARDFIKNIRMKQAAYLLTTSKINIGEIGYAIGYSNLSHFSKSFKAYYGVSPKEYSSKQHES